MAFSEYLHIPPELSKVNIQVAGVVSIPGWGAFYNKHHLLQ